MAEPHKCPVCVDKTDKQAEGCPGCGGTRVVWEPEEAAVGAEDPLHIDGL